MAAHQQKFVTQSFLDQIDDEDVLTAILQLRRRGNQPELLPTKDRTPVLHRLRERSPIQKARERPLHHG
jgi:hypothetical protein